MNVIKTLLAPRIPVRPFDLEEALKGAPFIHKFDATRPDAWQRVSTTIKHVEDPEHSFYAVYVGEWLVFDISKGEDEEMDDVLYLVDGQTDAAKEAA